MPSIPAPLTRPAVATPNTPDARPPHFTYADIEFAVPHLQSGRLALDETVVDGFEGIVDAFLGVLRGRNTGKVIVRDRTQLP